MSSELKDQVRAYCIPFQLEPNFPEIHKKDDANKKKQ